MWSIRSSCVWGAPHLEQLTRIVAGGGRAGLVYGVQRGDARAVKAAADVDPVYAGALREARNAGVFVQAVQVAVSPTRLAPWRLRPVLE